MSSIGHKEGEDLFQEYITNIKPKFFDKSQDFFQDNFSVPKEIYDRVLAARGEELKQVTAEVRHLVYDIILPRFTKFYVAFEENVMKMVTKGKTGNQAQNDGVYKQILGDIFPRLIMDGYEVSYWPNCIGIELSDFYKSFDQPVLMTDGFVETGVSFVQFMYHWMHKLKLLLMVELGQSSLFMCHGDKHNMTASLEFIHLLRYGCAKPSREEMRRKLKSRDIGTLCSSGVTPTMPSFMDNKHMIFTFDTNLLALPFFSSKAAVLKFCKEHGSKGGVFANVYIIKCLYAGFYGLRDRRFYQGQTDDEDTQIISAGYHKLLSGYARFAVSMLSDDVYKRDDSNNGMIISIDNDILPEFGMFSEYIKNIAVSKKKSLVGTIVNVRDRATALVHKLVDSDMILSGGRYKDVITSNIVPRVPNFGEKYVDFVRRKVGAAPEKYKRDVVSSSANNSSGSYEKGSNSPRSKDSWVMVEKGSSNITCKRGNKAGCMLMGGKRKVKRSLKCK